MVLAAATLSKRAIRVSLPSELTMRFLTLSCARSSVAKSRARGLQS